MAEYSEYKRTKESVRAVAAKKKSVELRLPAQRINHRKADFASRAYVQTRPKLVLSFPGGVRPLSLGSSAALRRGIHGYRARLTGKRLYYAEEPAARTTTTKYSSPRRCIFEHCAMQSSLCSGTCIPWYSGPSLIGASRLYP